MGIEDLTPEVLRNLYVEKGHTEQQIAEMYGTYQVAVGRLRRKWGIETVGVTGRMAKALPPLTDIQTEVLVGSLLGDGGMDAPSDRTARYNERHCMEQAPYLLWKAEVLGDHVAKVFDVVKRTGGKEYPAKVLTTHASVHLRPLYDLFYGTGNRVFPAQLFRMLTPRGLAVWYQDDGSPGNYSPTIAFGLDDLSLKRAVRALRRLGFNPEVYGSGGNSSLGFPGQAESFFAMVKPYVHPCMSYKVQEPGDRRTNDKNARKLTPEVAVQLIEGGMTYNQVGDLFQVGVTTVRRRVGDAGRPIQRMGRPRQFYSRVAAEVALGKYDPAQWEGLDDSTKNQWVDEICRILRATDFPFPTLMEGTTALEEFTRVKNLPSRLVDGQIRPQSSVGVRLCDGYFQNRYRACWRKNKSAFEFWHTDQDLRRAVVFQLRVGDKVLPNRVLKAVTLLCRTPTVFRPGVSQYVCRTFCPADGLVWDPCAGFGGRLVGALAAGVRYVGTDVEPDTVAGNNRLAQVLGMSDRAKVVLHPAETFTPPDGVDLVFTSPPYFSTEVYGASEGQSVNRHRTFDTWTEGFLRPLVRTAHRVLSAGKYLVLNIADVKFRGVTWPLVATTTQVAREEGFDLDTTLYMPIHQLNRTVRGEPVLVFKRK